MKLKSLSLAMAFATLASSAVFAQDPTTSAPVPSHSPDQVKSAFSDAYTAFTKWDRQHGATMETITINGNDNVLKFSGDYVAVSLGGRKLNDMEYLHADVYSPASGGVNQVRFGFALFSGGEKYADAYNTDTPAGQWTSIDIPLSAFNGYDFSNTQVFRMTMTKTNGNTFYLDNVYFYKGDGGGTPVTPPVVDPDPSTDPNAPSASAPTPTCAADNVLSAFSDTYPAFTKWDRQHGATMDIVTIAGNDNDHVAKFSGEYVAISLGGRKLSDMEYFHADIFAPASGGVSQVRFGFALFSGGEKYADAYNTDTPAGQWVSVDIPLSAFNGYDFSNTQVFRMTMTKTNGNIFYLDNVYFYKDGGSSVDPTPEPSTFDIKPAPVPTNAAATVKSVYSDAYTSVYSFTNAGGNSGIEEEEVTITPTDKAIKLTGYTWVKYSLGTVDASDMTFLHVDVATPDGNDACANIQPILVNGSTSFYTGSPELTKGKWTSLNIKLADFTAKGLDASTINEIRFKHSGTGSIVIDNVYFCTEEGAKGTTDANWGGTPVEPGPEIPLAPVPTHDATDVKAFFSDAYPNLFGKFEIASYGEGIVEIIDQAEGQQVCRITNFNWVPVNLGARDVSDKGYVHFDFYTPADDAVQTINVGFQNWNAADGSSYEIAGEDANYRTLEPGKWNSFDIPLSNFPNFDFATQMAVLRLRKGGSGKTLYVDNVYFHGKPGETPGPGPDDPIYKPIQDDSDGELPDMNTPMLGVNLASASGGGVPGKFGYDYVYPKKQDLYYYKAKGVRLLRLPFRAARFVEDIKTPGTDYENGNKSDFAAMKEIVAEAERLGLWVFLDAHDYAERTIDGTQYLIGQGEYTIERFAKMWGVIASEFKDYKNIWGYDLQNEPKVSAQVLVEAYQAAINEIRKVDTRAQIIVEGTNWASAYEWIYGDRADKKYPEYSTEVAWSYKENSPWLLAQLNDPQNKIVYQAHGYFDKDNSGTYQKGYADVDYRKRFLPFLEWCRTNGVKGLIGEFGVPYNEHDSGDPRYMDVLDGALRLFREYGMNATYWAGGAMYESYGLSCQPDKNALYGNYAVEKSTMKVLEKYFTDWATGQSGIENVSVSNGVATEGRTYNLMGVEVDSNYVGIVIRDGKKILQK